MASYTMLKKIGLETGKHLNVAMAEQGMKVTIQVIVRLTFEIYQDEDLVMYCR